MQSDALEPAQAFGHKIKGNAVNSLSFHWVGECFQGEFSVAIDQPLPAERKLARIKKRARKEDPFGKLLKASEAPDIYVIVMGWAKTDDDA